MNDKNFVQSILPTAKSGSMVDTSFGVGPEYDPSEPMYIVYALDKLSREYIVGNSRVSEDDAWKQVADTFRQKMLSQLEGE